MKSNAWQDTSKANWIDYALCWLSSVLAVYSCGQAVGTNIVSTLGVAGVTVGILISYFVRSKLENTKIVRADGVLYCVLAWVAVLFARQMNAAIFPEDTFPNELTPSSWLLWMTIFGSFFAWRDGTLIFQSIPALAIFGFVGCYDTFKIVPVLFFIFIICFATLFARAHGREMQTRAVLSGYFSLGRNAQMNPEEQSALLREGPWRWAAGAEWALGSALIIVVLSSIGAPVIQATARPLSGLVTIRAPKLRNNPITQSAAAVPSSTRVGNGPVRLGDVPYFEVSGNVPEYLRIGIYNLWTGTSWVVTEPLGAQGRRLVNRMTGENLGDSTIERSEKFSFPNKKLNEFSDEYHSQELVVRSLIMTREVPQAGNDPTFVGNNPYDKTGAGISLKDANRYEGKVVYDKVPSVDQSSQVPKVLNLQLYSLVSTKLVDPAIVDLAETTTKTIDGDFEKANALKDKISRLIKYNTNCPSTPDGRDPVKYALTESHEGYCDLFASAMVQMARSVKIPARYVIGYLPDSKNKNSSGTQLLLESDRHAWAELYFDNVGWVPYDATEGAEVVPGGGRKDNKPTDYNQVIRTIGLVINILIVIAVIAGFLIYIRIRRLPKTVVMIRSELDAQYVSFIGSIWKFTSHRRLLSETTNEYLGRVGGELGELRETADRIGMQFTNLMFGQPDILAEDVAATRESVQNFKGLLAKMQKPQ